MRRIALRLLLVTAGLAAIAAIVFYLGGAWLLNKETRNVIPEIIAAVGDESGKLQQITFEEVRVVPWAVAHWNNVTLKARPPPTASHPAPSSIRIRISVLTARLAGTSPLRVDLRFDGVRVDSGLHLDAPEDVPFGGDEFDVPLDKVDAGAATLLDIPIGRNLRARTKAELESVIAFFREGTTQRDFQLSARLHFRLHGMPMSVRLETQRRNGTTRLRINRSDLDILSHRYARPLTPTERDLIAASPLKAPVLLRIKEYCERAAHRLAARDSAYNEDSTRHVLWSYWLARTYGSDFAEQVTEAHEIGSANTPGESARDRANNTLGRILADTKKTEGQVVHLVKTDSRVVR